MVDLRSKFLGGMVGSALGDAIGEIAFRLPDRERLLGALARRETLVYTDDTAMAIGLAESLRERGEIDPARLGEVFRGNYEREPWRGYAMGPPALFDLVRRTGVSYTAAAASLFGGSGSFGNGAAMRIAPLGLFFHRAADLYAQAAASAEVTHAHPIGVDGAAVLARAVARAVREDPGAGIRPAEWARDLAAFARTEEMRERLGLIPALLEEDHPPGEAARRLGRGIEAHLSAPYAVYAFLRRPDAFEECLLGAVLHGGDRDTLGAMACGISGAYLGVEAIPEEWRGKLENLAIIEELAEALLARSA
ncbi:MAG: ADP-ribosylglycohydrolase family protein [bacterium]